MEIKPKAEAWARTAAVKRSGSDQGTTSVTTTTIVVRIGPGTETRTGKSGRENFRGKDRNRSRARESDRAKDRNSAYGTGSCIYLLLQWQVWNNNAIQERCGCL